MFGLLGPNGAGKSTTVRVLVTLTTPDEGSASVGGHDVRRDPSAVRRTIGYVPQDSGVDQLGTGRENLMLQGRVQGMGGRELRARADELLELVGIADAADRIVKTYSGGMRRRLDIALGLVHRPRVLFLDEPTTGLDPEARVAMWSEVSRLAEAESLTILLTTHYLEEADELADRLAIVSQGKVVVSGTPAELKHGLAGDALHVELENGAVEQAQQVLAAVGARPEQVLDGRVVVARVDERRPGAPVGAGGARRRRRRGRVGLGVASVARRRLPPLHGPRLQRRGPRGMKVASDTWFMVLRQIRNLMREPIWIVLLLVQPMVWLLLYGQLFKNVTRLGGFGTGSYVTFLAPAIVVMNAFFGATWSGMSMIYDLDHKVVERFLATPASRFALVLSQIVRSALTAAIQAVIILLVSLALGVRIHTGRCRLGRDHRRRDPRERRLRGHLAGDRAAHTARGDDDRGRELHRPAAALPLDDDDRAVADAGLDADRVEVQPRRLGRPRGARGRAAGHRRGARSGGTSCCCSRWRRSPPAGRRQTFRIYQRSL